MSYRSIKRVLGETSLERKCRFLFGVCLLLLITASFWWYGSQTEQLVNEQTRNTGRLLVDQVMLPALALEAATRRASTSDRDRRSCRSRSASRTYDVRLHPAEPAAGQGAEEPTSFARTTSSSRTVLAAVPGGMSRASPRRPTPANIDERMSEDGNKYHYYQPIRADGIVCFRLPSARRAASPARPTSGGRRDGIRGRGRRAT